ncbi:phage baseplate assembly protein V [Tepidimonas thermarum]|uniref:Phage baseplate assembly protein V n=1 Tax=Tepidimonas thermarum TaxID=335431 RepID=A0A554WXD0_9BURK|nr:phage baseplate assembly protein V [Tepidimonas thermarum]TSE28230.1 phage baseplate assembly protein V [Tepidimonas thermarum]
MSERHLHHDLTEDERRLSNVVLIGQVAELDATRARVRVRAGPILTGWLPFATVRAGPDRTWHAPEPGEQVVLVAPGGDLTQAVVVGSLYRDAYPPPADDPDISRTVWQDGAVLEYDRRQHYWHLSVPSGGRIVIEVGPSKIEMDDAGIRITAPRIDLN